MQLYPSCFNANEEMDTTCISIVNEDSLNVFLLNISNLDGIQYFDNLEYLFCDKNQLTSLPNLPQDELFFENADDATIQLFDFTGKLVLETEVKEGRINVASVPNGMYIVNLFRDKVQILQTKLSIQK